MKHSTSALAAVCGVLAGIGGPVHGIGEIRQGCESPGGLVFNPWDRGRIATNLGGEPDASQLFGYGLLTLTVVFAVTVISGVRPDATAYGRRDDRIGQVDG